MLYKSSDLYEDDPVSQASGQEGGHQVETLVKCEKGESPVNSEETIGRNCSVVF